MGIVIGLDAGHGGQSLGTYSCNTNNDKRYEKYYTLELAKLVKERLTRNGFEVVMTREEDVNCGNVSQRANFFVKNKVNYAVSIHFNGVTNQSAKGCEVFVPYAESGAGIEAGYYKYLGRFFKTRVPFARSNSYYDRNETYDKKLNVNTRKFEAVTNSKKDYFGVIRGCWSGGVSCDLLEVCFLTNPEDFNTYINNKAAIADAIARSIVEGYGQKYDGVKEDEQPAPAEQQKQDVIYRVQVGAFADKANAESMVKLLKEKGFAAIIKEEKQGG